MKANKNLWDYLEKVHVYYHNDRHRQVSCIDSSNAANDATVEFTVPIDQERDRAYEFDYDCEYRTIGNNIYLTDKKGRGIHFTCFHVTEATFEGLTS